MSICGVMEDQRERYFNEEASDQFYQKLLIGHLGCGLRAVGFNNVENN